MAHKRTRIFDSASERTTGRCRRFNPLIDSLRTLQNVADVPEVRRRCESTRHHSGETEDPPFALAVLALDDTAMTDSDAEPLVLDVVRRHTQNDSVTRDALFDRDLRLSDVSRQMLWASMAQAFAARG